MSRRRPSYSAGFYTPKRGGIARHPELWRGCVGAWAPLLGSTGDRLFDHSVNSNIGVLTGMDPATDWISSQGQWALDFDGSNDYIAVGNPPALQITKGLSLCAWVRLASSGRQQQIMAKDVSTQRSYVLDQAGTNLRFYLPGNSGAITSAAEPPINTWTSVVGTYTRGTGAMRLYLAGRLINTTTITAADINNGTANVNLGRREFGGFQDPFLGQLDDFRIYNRDLAPAEIELLGLRRGISYELAPKSLTRTGPLVSSSNLYLPAFTVGWW